jgi:PTS system mannose-specific IIA component
MSNEKRIGAVIVSHGDVARELVAASKAVVGDIDHIRSVSIDWNVDVEAAQEQISKAIEEVSDGSGVILLTDMFGGTPTNISAMFLDKADVEIVTGVNLPMVIKVASANSDLPLLEFAKEVEDQGKESICRASTLLGPQKMKKDA